MLRNTGLMLLIATSLSILSMIGIAQAAERPNIVFILADDMGYGDPGCYNPKSKIPTPNLDRLATEGMRFTDAHSGASVCTPTRYGILMGRYCWRTWLKKSVMGSYGMPLLETERITLPEMLKEHGYATTCIGKWHLGMQWQRKDGGQSRPHTRKNPEKAMDLSKPIVDGPCNHGFDSFFGRGATNQPPYCFIENDHVVGPVPDRSKPKTMYGSRGLMQEGWKLERVLPAIGEKAVDYIRRHAAEKRDQPFFLYLPLPSPHTPIVPNKPFCGSTKATLYGDFVAETDDVVGRVLKALDETGLAENTIVVMTSDNGSPGRNGQNGAGPVGSCLRDSGHNPSGPWRGRKGDIHEGGHRVPLIVRWPGHVRAGSTSAELICLTDFYATLAAVLGHDLSVNTAEDSFNMLPALLEKNLPGPIRPSIVHHSHQGMFAIREGDWKLILGQGSGSGFTKIEIPPDAPPGQLYNLKDDPKEQNNLFNKRIDVARRLYKKLDKLIESSDYAKKLSEETDKVASQLEKKIEAEIKSLADHPWAGFYYYGDSLMNSYLWLAPKAGYLFEWHGCGGLVDRNYGKVSPKNGRIKLSLTFRRGIHNIAEELLLVTWGKRMYLVPADDVVGFCNEVNSGSEPRSTAHGFYFLRLKDYEKKVDGMPNVPRLIRHIY